MSILIKGMKMPPSCFECPCCDTYHGTCKATKSRVLAFHGIPKWCPIIEIPTPHGRLIDESWLKERMIETLEALKKHPIMDKQEAHLIAAFDTLRVMIEDAPTIIEAEGGG